MPLSQHDALIAAGNDLETIITKAQRILEKRLKPDGICAEETIDELLGLLDGPEQRAAQEEWKSAKELPQAPL
jgi:hypothetical protein